MKKIVFVLIVVTMLFTACNSNSKPSAKHDFLNVDFGMSTIELLEIEGEPDSEISSPPSSKKNISTYLYDGKNVWGMQDVTISYSVDENGVVAAYVGFSNTYSDNKSYLTEFEAVKKKLISEWGEPVETIEDENTFKHICSWGNKFLVLYRKDNSMIFHVEGYRQDYFENSPWTTEEWTTE